MKTRVGPQVAAEQGEGIREGWLGFGIPGRLPHGEGRLRHGLLRIESRQREQAEQSWGRAANRQLAPLALGLPTQMAAHFLEGDFDLPTLEKPGEDLCGGDTGVRTEQRLGREVALRVA